MGSLDGRIAVVTGAGKGIGEAIVRRFLQEGIRGIAMFEWNEALCRETAQRLDPSGDILYPITCDISDREQVRESVRKTLEHFGTVDILVNNAAITKDRIFHKMSDAEWDAVINVNLNGTYNMCRNIVPILREKGYGRIVNISSTSAWGNPGQANYAATKAAVQGLTATLAKELAQKGVIVNAIAPGFIDTDMYATIPEDVKAQFLKKIPMNRLGKPEELAAVVAFLCGPDVTFMTGQCLIVSGGHRS